MKAIEVDSLSVESPSGKRLLKDINLTINDGDFCLVCGRPGSGKTLLLKAMKGLLHDRDDLRVYGAIKTHKRLGIMFQHPEKQIVRRKVKLDVAFELENLGYPVEKIKEKIKRYAEWLEAEHLLEKNIGQLSHGELTKVALLSSLVAEPDVILLDEPLTPLDYKNQKILLSSIDELTKKEKTVIIAEHDARELLKRSNKVLLMRNGEMIKKGNPSNLVSSLYKEGIKLPFNTVIALEAGEKNIPLHIEEAHD